MSDTIEIEKAIIKKLASNFILLRFKSNVVFDVPDAKKTDEIAYEMMEGKPYLTLVDARIYGKITKEARSYFANNELVKDLRIAQAIVLNNLPSKIIAKFYIRYNSPSNPVAIFNSIDEAKKWLMEQLNIFEEKVNSSK